MRKLLAAATLVLPFMAAIGTGIAVAASGLPETVIEGHAASPFLHEAGDYLADGEFVVNCMRVIVGDTWAGWQVLSRSRG